ncbi:SymE family type I addiction module toxin [Serratia liquefaciens]|uniref:SymE family type I addiction module toxin n=1 Tax=Serratia liquefaciens TaxID=614 RepID=UPI001C2D6B1E|nr:SymE family type I addiction module toxin [Serratia liquefaciens]
MRARVLFEQVVQRLRAWQVLAVGLALRVRVDQVAGRVEGEVLHAQPALRFQQAAHRVVAVASWRYSQWRPQGYLDDPPLYHWMKLSGRWIEHAGFEAEQRVRITVEYGRLTITAQ